MVKIPSIVRAINKPDVVEFVTSPPSLIVRLSINTVTKSLVTNITTNRNALILAFVLFFMCLYISGFKTKTSKPSLI